MRRMTVLLGAAACILLLAGGDAGAGRSLTAMRNGDGKGGAYVNLIVREVRVTPVRAHVGDKIRIDAVIENVGEGRGTTQVKAYANRKLVVSELFGWGESEDRIYRKSFLWDTKGVAPGEYRIRVEVFLWEDASPFDNDLAVKEPVTLLAAGMQFPAGETAGGTAVAVDSRWKTDRSAAGKEKQREPEPVIQGY